jgi:ketosteroid isomerase-like protein
LHPNEQLIHSFYKAFQNKDYKTMQQSYADNAAFTDPVFINLNAEKTRTMWEMFCVNGKNLSIEFQNIKADETQGSGEWIATYTFSKSGKKVINHIYSKFKFENGKISEHVDTFNFYKWVKQALGLTGLLLGWTPFIKQKVQQGAMKNLNDYQSRKQAS